MLDKLYKKLHRIFVVCIMLIITLIFGIICANTVRMERVNDLTFFQRMSMLMIYQIEADDESAPEIIQSYEKSDSIFSLLKDSNGNVVYQSSIHFPTDAKTLLNYFEKQQHSRLSTTLSGAPSTVPEGIFKIRGNSSDSYLGMPATIISQSGNHYHLTLIYKQESLTRLLFNHLPFYLLLWAASLAGVMLVSHFLLKKALAPTERVLKSQKDFVAAASHELKSPLAVIMANVDVLDHSVISDTESAKAVKIIDSECMRMSKLVKDMLFLASSDAKTWRINKSYVNVDTLLITLYETYEPVCRGKKLRLNLDIADSIYPVFYTDEERLFQILSIFMDNAIAHSADNSSIEIQTSLTAKQLTFYIIDHGSGIAEKDKPHIFDRFYCSDKSRTDKSHFGLGLSIADELAKMLNGKVGFTDTVGGGATFFIKFSLKNA